MIPVVNFLAVGFAMECSGVGKFKKKDAMPEWDDWGGYFVKGLFAIIIGLLYALPGLLILLAGAGGAFITGGFKALLAGNPMGMLSSLATFAPLLVVGGLILLLGGYLGTAGVLGYLKTNDFAKAFAFSEVKKKAFSGSYFVAWLVGAVLGGILSMILAPVPVVGSGIAVFVVSVFTYTLLGETYLGSK